MSALSLLSEERTTRRSLTERNEQRRHEQDDYQHGRAGPVDRAGVGEGKRVCGEEATDTGEVSLSGSARAAKEDR